MQRPENAKFLLTILLCAVFPAFCADLFGQPTEPVQLFPVRQNGKWGYINRKGEIVIKPQFVRVSQSNYKFNPGWTEGLAPVLFANGAWGYIDRTGKTVIKAQFSEANRFSEGLARVMFGRDGLAGYIDRNGETVIPPKYCFMGELGDFKEGLAYVSVIPGCFFISHSKADRRTEYGYIDKTGRMIIPMSGVGWFSEGLAPVWINDKVGFINKEGKMVIPARFKTAQSFYEGFSYVVLNEKHLYVDTKGRMIQPPRNYYVVCCDYSEGFARIIGKNHKYGYMDRTGKIVIAPRFDGVEEFSEGLAAVNIGADETYSGGKWGYIDKTGKVVIDFKFEKAEPFYDGLAMVGDHHTGKTGYIDKTGKYVWEPTK